MKNEIVKKKHGAGGYVFSLAEKGNTRFGDKKKKAIVKALQHPWTEGVYQTEKGEVIRQLLNGNSEKI